MGDAAESRVWCAGGIFEALGLALLLTCLLPYLFDFAAADPDSVALLGTFGFGDLSLAVCFGMLAASLLLVVSQAIVCTPLIIGIPAASVALVCCVAGLASFWAGPIFRIPAGALLGSGFVILTFFWLQPGKGYGPRESLPHVLVSAGVTLFTASLLDCLVLGLPNDVVNAALSILGLGGVAASALGVYLYGRAKGCGPDAEGAQAAERLSEDRSGVGCVAMDDVLFGRGPWRTVALLALPLACAYEANVLMSSSGGPSVAVLGTPGAALDLAVCSLVTALVGALLPRQLPIVYWGALPFVGAFAFTIELSRIRAVYLFHVSGITLFFGMSFLLCIGLLVYQARRGGISAAAAVGTLCATLSVASLARMMLGFPDIVDPTSELIPNVLIAGWIAYALVFWAGLLRMRCATGGKAEECLADKPNDAARLLGERFGLSAREEEIVTYVAQGYNAPYIAERLSISDSTVRSHLRVVYQKAGVSSRMELVDLLREMSA